MFEWLLLGQLRGAKPFLAPHSTSRSGEGSGVRGRGSGSPGPRGWEVPGLQPLSTAALLPARPPGLAPGKRAAAEVPSANLIPTPSSQDAADMKSNQTLSQPDQGVPRICDQRCRLPSMPLGVLPGPTPPPPGVGLHPPQSSDKAALKRAGRARGIMPSALCTPATRRGSSLGALRPVHSRADKDGPLPGRHACSCPCSALTAPREQGHWY